MKILIINGPNLNLLGTREPEIYGGETLGQIEEFVKKCFKDKKLNLEFFQSNIEGELINKIQNTKNASGIVINPAGYSYTSVALRDTLLSLKIPAVEVHLSNIFSREDFRQKSIIAPVCKGQICGFGKNVYTLGIEAILNLIEKK